MKMYQCIRNCIVIATVLLCSFAWFMPQTSHAQSYTHVMSQLAQHNQGNITLSEAELDAVRNSLISQAGQLKGDPSLIQGGFNIIQQYENIHGPLFTDSGTKQFATNGTNDGNALERAMQQLYLNLFDSVDADLISTHPDIVEGLVFGSHEYFPGSVPAPANPNAVYETKINASVPEDWGRPNLYSKLPARRPTGAYLAPGTIAEVTVPAALVNKGYQIRVGAHSWDLSNKPVQKRLARVTKLYPVTSTTTQVANPMGGNIYIEVPHLADDGMVTIQLKNTIRAPYFSARSFDQITNSEWQTERAYPGAWTDIETDKVMMQVPSKWVRNYAYSDMMTLLNDYDTNMDFVSDLMGKPHVRNKTMVYMQVDVIMRGAAFYPGYPMGNYPNFASDTPQAPLVEGHAFDQIFLHEHGHATYITKFTTNERESMVHLLYPYIATERYGTPLEEAFSNSLGYAKSSERTMDEVFISWALRDSFINGTDMGYENAAYKHRGHADYIEYVELFGWDAFTEVNRKLNVDYVESGYYFHQNEHENNDRILRFSREAGVDVRPLFHLWGHSATNQNTLQASLEAENLLPSPRIYDLMVAYKPTIPLTQGEYNTWYTKMSAVLFTGHKTELWDPLAEQYDTTRAKAAVARIDELITYYFPNGRPDGQSGEQTNCDSNVALNKRVTGYSSQYPNAKWYAQNINDGIVSEDRFGWASMVGSGERDEWVTIDLGEAQTISSFTIQGEFRNDNRNVEDYVLYGSTTGAFNGEEFVIKSGSIPKLLKSQEHTVSFAPATAQYVKFQATSSYSPYVIVGELSLFGCTDDSNAPAVTEVTQFPSDLQLYPRDVASNIATAPVSGVIGRDTTKVTLNLYRDGQFVFSWNQNASDSREFLFNVGLKAMLANYEFVLIGTDQNSNETIIESATDVVAGDVFVINGQSNAASGIFSAVGPGAADSSEFIRTYGTWTQSEDWVANDNWYVTITECRPFSNPTGCIGRWGQRLAYNIVTSEQVPVAVINGAYGGQPIEHFERNDANPSDTSTNYGRMLTKLSMAGLENDIRGWLWYQGESDRLNIQGHIDGFTALFADWETDYPSVEQYYITQIRHTCTASDLVTGQGSEISNFQREFANAKQNATPLSTTGIDVHDGCHYGYEGYKQLGDSSSRILRQDLYNQSLVDADAADITTAELVDSKTVKLTFTANNTLIADNEFEALFELRDRNNNVVYQIIDGAVLNGKTVQLTLNKPVPTSTNLDLHYYSFSGDQNWLTNQEGIGILSFIDFPVERVDFPVEQVVDIVGYYERLPILNNWHKVEILEDEDGLWWTNAAGRRCPLSWRDGKLMEDATCAYGERETGVTLDENGQVIALIFGGEPYYRTIPLTNLAYQKSVAQSSTTHNGVPKRAVDGNSSGVWGDNSVTHTDGGTANAPSWWEVDLGTVSDIAEITLWNRTNCCAERLNNVHLFVSDVPFANTTLTSSQSQLGVSEYYVAGVVGEKTTLDINRTGRYVRVQLSVPGILSLAEVQVFGSPLTNLAYQKSVDQSMTRHGGVPGRAVDGNSNGAFFDGSVTHTDGGTTNTPSWWEVDLGEASDITDIKLWNRTDCCSSRLNNVHLFVSDVPFANTTLTSSQNQSGVSDYYAAGQAGELTAVDVNRTGRYVRVQLSTPGILSLAEVQVFGR